VTSEPRVEELLATIRRAIDRDINELDARDSREAEQPKLRGSIVQETPMQLPRLERNADSDLASLRNRVQRHKLDAPEDIAPPVPRATPSTYRYLTDHKLREPNYASPAPVPYYPPHAQSWEESPPEPYLEQQPIYDEPQYEQAPPMEYAPESLMSQQAAYAAQASFQALANSMMNQLGGDAGLQEKARELLKPMLKSWLDDHLPSLVERMVRDEIERVARRGR